RAGSRASHWLRNCSSSASSAASTTSSFISGMGVTVLPGEPGHSAFIGGVGFVAADFARGGAGDHGGGLTVDDHPEVVVLADHGGGLARVDHPGVDLLPGDHEPAPGG